MASERSPVTQDLHVSLPQRSVLQTPGSERSFFRRWGWSRPSSFAATSRRQRPGKIGRHGSHTPRVGSQTAQAQALARQETARANISYEPRSWLSTFRLLDVTSEEPFVLTPWLFLTLLATAVPVSIHLHEGAADFLSGGLPPAATVALGSTMSMLLAFRLNASYSRWSSARSLWGGVILASRSLLTQLIATATAQAAATAAAADLAVDGRARLSMASTRDGSDSQLPTAVHEMHAQIGGWCLAFAVALKYHLRGIPLPFDNGSSQAQEGEQEGLHRLLSAAQLSHLAQSSHPPMYAISRLRHAIEYALLLRAAPQHALSAQHALAVSHELFGVTDCLLESLTGCERILRTPLPPGYMGMLGVLMVRLPIACS